MPQLSIDEEYVKRHASSQPLFERAQQIFPRGATHDNRYFLPFPHYIVRASGSHKWDVDGNEFIDYWVGHGALLLGHSYPEVTSAVCAQLANGTHYGAPQLLEIEWGEQVRKMVPSAEKVEFTSSGTEATLMALRLARAHTSKKMVIKLEGHFHGWHDYSVVGVKPPFDIPMSAGVPGETTSTMIVVPANDIPAMQAALEQSDDVAAVILEPSGASYGTVPIGPEYLRELRQLTKAHDVVLIFDEVITGFRYAPGGVQEYYDIIPDMTTLAKILAGGLPGGAVTGKVEIMDRLLMKSDAKWNRGQRIAHPGTFNANPVSAAAGLTCLRVIEDGRAQKRAAALAGKLRDGCNEIVKREGIPGCVYGESSMFHFLLGESCPDFDQCSKDYCRLSSERLLNGMGALGPKLRRALLLEGVDLMGAGGMLSVVHTDADIGHTLEAFTTAVRRLKDEKSFAQR